MKTPFLWLSVAVIVGAFVFVANRRPSAVGQDVEEAKKSDRNWDEAEERKRQREFEWHLREMEVQKNELQMRMARLDTARRLLESAQTEDGAAAVAVSMVSEMFEPPEAAEILGDMINGAKSPVVQRIMRLKLAELHRYGDRRDAALEHLRRLIVRFQVLEGEREREREAEQREAEEQKEREKEEPRPDDREKKNGDDA